MKMRKNVRTQAGSKRNAFSRPRHNFLKSTGALAAVWLVLASIPGCKKTPYTPDPEDLKRPVIWLSISEVSFTASEFGPNPSGQTLKVKNSGQKTLNYQISDDAGWLTVEPASGISTDQTNEHTILIDKTGLAAQDADYRATVTVACSEAYNNPQKVFVRLKLSKEPPPAISVSPQTLGFAAQFGGANPPPQSITIRNSGQSTLNYTISDDAAWLDVNPAQGTSSGENKTHSVSVSSGGLAEGTFNATITITDPNATNNPQTVAVSLSVSKQPPPSIGVDKSSLSFSAQVGGSPAPQTIDIRNTGGGTLNYTISSSQSWLTVSPGSGTSTGGAVRHTVSANAAGLGEGTYSGTLTIAAPGASNSPQLVGVTLQIASIPTNNEIGVTCNPSSGKTGDTVSCSIYIYGNTKSLSAFGLQLKFDTSMFEYVGTNKGSLTGSWAYVDGSHSSGTVTLGGFAGGASPIPVGSSGTLAVVVLRVTGGSYPNGQKSTITIDSYTDDVSGMKPEPAATTFTYQK